MFETNRERRLLACVLIRPDILPTLRAYVSRGDFTDRRMLVMFDALCHLQDNAHDLSFENITELTLGGVSWSLYQAIRDSKAHAGDWADWALQVVWESKRRKLDSLLRSCLSGFEDLELVICRLIHEAELLLRELHLAQRGLGRCKREKSGRSPKAAKGT